MKKVDLTLKLFRRFMKPVLKVQRDYDLLAHGALKWKTIKNLVKFEDKTVLDIGCHVAYIPLQMAANGAKSVHAVDQRSDVVAVSDNVANWNKLNNITFSEAWLDKVAPEKYDIVSCLGVLHKFDPPNYIEQLKKLCNMCKETLILDMLVIYDPTEKTVVHHDGGRWNIRTQVTVKWLTKQLELNGFEVTDRVRSTKFPERAIWVARRKG